MEPLDSIEQAEMPPEETAYFPGSGLKSRRRSAVDLEVIIPAYNEAGRLPSTLRNTADFLGSQPWNSRIVVVDNGSADDTGYVVRRMSASNGRVPISLIGCSRSGKGAAVRRGLLSGTSTYTGFFDADLATPLDTLTAAMEHLELGASAVIASRHSPGSTFVRRQQFRRRLGGAAFRVITSSMVRGVCDTQCGFKFFERGAITRAMVQCRTAGFAFDVELLRYLQYEGGRIIEIPVAWTDGTDSTFHLVRDGVTSFVSLSQMQRLL
ncbi:glycosyltransferase involved in cell wall biosynthesis [Arthrobacter sp. CAN_A6]|uniref:glycosyltransferase n=1 Tax=Arthrobacter sp. CAN_A6 TaxID=2787721 RepID=UPI001A1852C8